MYFFKLISVRNYNSSYEILNNSTEIGKKVRFMLSALFLGSTKVTIEYLLGIRSETNMIGGFG